MWRIQAVTAEGTAFTNRLSLPAAWRGLRDADLCAAVGMDGCKFVHNAGECQVEHRRGPRPDLIHPAPVIHPFTRFLISA